MSKGPTEEQMGRMARAIGALFVNFSGLEHTMTLTVAAMLRLSELQERPLVRGMMARAKLDMLDTFAQVHWQKESLATLLEITRPARKLADYRNDFAHGIISHDAEGNWAIVSYRGKHRFKGIAKPFTVLDVLQRSIEAEMLAGQFSFLAETISQHPPSAPTPQNP